MVLKALNKRSAGFTITELVIVVAVISILGGIALPNYVTHRARSYDTLAKDVLRAVVMAEEAYFVENETYLDCDQTTCQALLGSNAFVPEDVIVTVTSTETEFTASSRHLKGTGQVFSWN